MKKIFNTKNITKVNLWIAIIACMYHGLEYLITGTTLLASFSTWASILVVWFLIYMEEKNSEKVDETVGNTEK